MIALLLPLLECGQFKHFCRELIQNKSSGNRLAMEQRDKNFSHALNFTMNLKWKSLGESHIKRASSGKLNKTFVFDDNSLLFADAELFFILLSKFQLRSFLGQAKTESCKE